jgi:hypothetical protein
VRFALALVALLLIAEPASAQTAAPACPPGVAPSATLRAHELATGAAALTATHTIALEIETATGATLDDFTLTLPVGATRVRAGPSPAFRADTPGPISVTATWLEYDPNADADCSASVAGTFTLAAPRRLRFVAPRPGTRGISELEWSLRIGRQSDLRPVELRLRGVRRARLPGASAPLKTLTLGLRSGDPGQQLTGSGRVLRSAGWRFRVGPFFRGEFPILMSKPQRSRQTGFGFDLELVQGGRRIGHTRGVGRCKFTSVGPLCRARIMR